MDVVHLDLEKLDIVAKKKLCDLLDSAEDDWKILARLMGFSESDINVNEFYRSLLIIFCLHFEFFS
jgi:Death domain